MDGLERMESLGGKKFELHIGRQGGMEVAIGGESYFLESSFSFPGEAIGTNYLSEERIGDDPGWTPVLKRISPTQVEISASGAYYHLCRTISLERHRISVSDDITSHAREDIGIIVRNRISTPGTPRPALLGGTPRSELRMTAENPTMLISQDRSQVGLLAEDTVSRLQFQAQAHRNGAEFSLNRMAIRSGGSRVMRWAIYPDRTIDYFAFINRIRSDWKVNFTVSGPLDGIGAANYKLLKDSERLKAYLGRKKMRIARLTPWLDYTNFNSLTGKPVDRKEYKELMAGAIAALKTVDPDIKCIGSMEGNLVSLPLDAQKTLYEALPPELREQDIRPFTDRQMELISDLKLRWQDCLLTTSDGRYVYEVYYPAKTFPMMAIAVYAAPGNDQMEYWLDQARFMIEEVGMDGVYIDQFSLAFNDLQRYSYDRWDGLTVDIDPATGKITRRYTDGAFVGVGARKAFIEYVLSRGGVVVANTHCAAEELQRYPIFRFMETEWAFDPLEFDLGEEPPLCEYICKGQLDSPIAFGYRPDRLGEEGLQNYTEIIMRSAITYLRHGLLYYHYGTEIPENGPGSGEYHPINHMFPLTPVELHEGWILGKERMVSCISVETMWEGGDRPSVHIFDLTGREKDPKGQYQIKGGKGEWHVELKLDDWREIAVVETEEM